MADNTGVPEFDEKEPTDKAARVAYLEAELARLMPCYKPQPEPGETGTLEARIEIELESDSGRRDPIERIKLFKGLLRDALAALRKMQGIKVWSPTEACGPTSPFEYDHGDVVIVHYDDLYDLVHPRSQDGTPITALKSLREKIRKRGLHLTDLWVVNELEAALRTPRCGCHSGSVCSAACEQGKHHDGCETGAPR